MPITQKEKKLFVLKLQELFVWIQPPDDVLMQRN